MTTPPQLDHEAILLGALLSGRARLRDVPLTADQFVHPRHVALFEAITAAHDQHGDHAGQLQVLDAIRARPDAARLLAQFRNGLALVEYGELAEHEFVLPDWHAGQIADAARLRALRTEAERLMHHVEAVEAGRLDLDDLPDVVVDRFRALLDLAEGGGPAAARTPAQPAALEFTALADLCARVDAAGPRRWLLRGLWPAGDYGVHAAEQKAQKTWNTVDLAVSVASGTPWLGAVEVETPGPVLMFAGEGSESNLVRRIRAVCAARDVTPEHLPITVCTRAPHLSDRAHLDAMAAQIAAVRPALVTLDPLYLAARGAQASSLYEMGAVLEGPQHLCQAAGAALFVVTHYNRKEGRGAGRITGAGPAEWGRVLIGATVKARRIDLVTQETTVTVELDLIGGEIPDQTLRVTRRIRSDRPDDIDSPLRYSVAAEHVDPGSGDTEQASGELKPSERKLVAAARDLGGWHTSAELVDRVAADHGHGLKRETVSRALNRLAELGLMLRSESSGVGQHALWIAVEDAQ